jgi:outer membrane murein-binding lipoprotein Lpp
MKRAIVLGLVAGLISGLLFLGIASLRASKPPQPDPAIAQLSQRVEALASQVEALELQAASLTADVGLTQGKVLVLERRIRRLESVVPVQAIRDRAKAKR